ncbi:MAG TPA: uracil-DNA glycosylase [Candidatus Paceibacterota bacterium]|nr:uracil-DNA glycosylase [Candidatus Paceibacterota bacterium]HPT18381.1 uracil-DNA glycosylase [Candidatus Paceibacterota bacterium]
MKKAEGLRKIHEKWFIDCTCGLKKTATQPVPGDGNPETQIVFIGEAPGKSEDEQGRPFVGAAGKFLAEMLENIGLKREEIYITNIVKYRPPNNRDPLPKEKDACRQWLHEELNFIKPKLIVFLGRHSMNDFFPDESISRIHGKLLIKKFQNIETKYFLPLYHPAAALYNGGMRETLMEDFKKIPKILEKIKKAETEESQKIANSKTEQAKLFRI